MSDLHRIVSQRSDSHQSANVTVGVVRLSDLIKQCVKHIGSYAAFLRFVGSINFDQIVNLFAKLDGFVIDCGKSLILVD